MRDAEMQIMHYAGMIHTRAIVLWNGWTELHRAEGVRTSSSGFEMDSSMRDRIIFRTRAR